MVNKYIKKLLNNEYIRRKERGYKLTRKGDKYIRENISAVKYEFKIFKNEIEDLFKSIQIDNFKKYRVGVLKSISGLVPHIAHKYKIDKKYNLEFNLLYYDTGKMLIDDLIDGKIELGIMGIIPAFFKRSLGYKININHVIKGGKHFLIYKNKYEGIKDLDQKRILISDKYNSVSSNLLTNIEKEENVKFKKIDFEDLNIKLDKLLNIKLFDRVDGILIWQPYAEAIMNKYENLDQYSIDRNYISNVFISRGKIENKNYKIIEQVFDESIQLLKEKGINKDILALFNISRDYLGKNFKDFKISIERKRSFQ